MSTELSQLIGSIARTEGLVDGWRVDAGGPAGSRILAWSRIDYASRESAFEAAKELASAIEDHQERRIRYAAPRAASTGDGRFRGEIELEFSP